MQGEPSEDYEKWRKNRKCKALEVGACLEFSRSRNTSGVAGKTEDREQPEIRAEG